MIKGKYVATLEIDFAIDENDPSLKPFDKIRDEVRHNLTPDIQGILAEEFEGYGKVTVNQLYADVYQGKRADNDDLTDGNTIKLPRKEANNGNHD